MKKVLITLLGRNEEGIRKDAIELLGEFDEYVIIARDGDKMLAERPDAVEISYFIKDSRKYVSVSNLVDDEVNNDHARDMTIICNGGTTSQLVPLIRKLSQSFSDPEGYWDDYWYNAKFIEIDRDKNIIEY